MPQFSLLTRIDRTTEAELQQLVACLEGQTLADWELVLLVSERQALDRELIADLTAVHPQVRSVVCPDGEAVYWSCNRLLDSLGTWTGFLGQRDRLLPDTLATVAAAAAAVPTAQVVYTDEEAINRWGLVTLRCSKGALNPTRLRAQEYLRDFAVVASAWLQSLGGFNRQTADRPSHDLYLRTLEAHGPAGFVHVPQRLYQRFRSHTSQRPDPRAAQRLPGFDLQAVRAHLARQGWPATLRQTAGTVEIAYQFPQRPALTLLVLLGDDVAFGTQQLLLLGQLPAYRPLTVRALHRGSDLAAGRQYQALCRGLHYAFGTLAPTGNLPAQLNLELDAVVTDYAGLLQGIAPKPGWLAPLVDHLLLPDAGAVGARLMTPIQLRQPGTRGYRFDGWDWNTRGRFNELAVPHQVATLSPYALLLDVRQFRAGGGFAETLPTLYGMDYCLRLDQAGRTNVQVPDSWVQVPDVVPGADAAEVAALQARWPGWSDRFDLYLPIE